MLERADPRHAVSLQAALEASHEELRLWMDWAGEEPQSMLTTEHYLAGRARAWDDREEFSYAMTDVGSGAVIGMTSLMARRGPGRLEIGYWVRTDRAGSGVATAAAGLLTDAALALDGIHTVQIHHDAANVASGRVPAKLGYRERERLTVEIDNPGESGVEVVWEFTRRGRP